MREQQEQQVSQVELFLNQVKLLANLTHDEKMRLLDALEEATYTPGAAVIKQVPLCRCQPSSCCPCEPFLTLRELYSGSHAAHS